MYISVSDLNQNSGFGRSNHYNTIEYYFQYKRGQMTSFQSSDDVSLFKAVKVIQLPFSDVTTESNSCPYNCSFVYITAK